MVNEGHALLQRFPRYALGSFPSPVRPAMVDGARFWIKDDGRCSRIYGGNKVRKLEFLLSEALKRRSKVLVVHGDIESHTVEACGIWGATAGFEVHAVVYRHGNEALDTPWLAALQQANVHVHRTRTMLGAVSRAHWIQRRQRAYLVPMGASTPLATLGYVRAALELGEQVAAGLLPEPRCIFLPFATGGSVAGLMVGLALMNARARVVGVQTVEGLIANRRRLDRLIRDTLDLLGIGRPYARRCMDRLERIDHSQLGRGYRDTTPRTLQAVAAAARHGLSLEPVQSGKAFAALLADLPRYPEGELLFWNTHDQHTAEVESEATS